MTPISSVMQIDNFRMLHRQEWYISWRKSYKSHARSNDYASVNQPWINTILLVLIGWIIIRVFVWNPMG